MGVVGFRVLGFCGITEVAAEFGGLETLKPNLCFRVWHLRGGCSEALNTVGPICRKCPSLSGDPNHMRIYTTLTRSHNPTSWSWLGLGLTASGG